MKFLKCLAWGVLLATAACVNHKKEDPQPVSACDPALNTYSLHVQPIIQHYCATAGCHVAGFPDGNFMVYDDLKAKVDNGSFKNSVIDWNSPQMPPTHKLADAELRVLQCWISNGAPEN